jgi:hypothetical protein
MSPEDEIASYIAERDEMLRALDVETFHAFYAKHKLPMPPAGWADPVIVPLIMMHKCRLQVATMTPIEREVSRQWLLSRGYTLPPGEGT